MTKNAKQIKLKQLKNLVKSLEAQMRQLKKEIENERD